MIRLRSLFKSRKRLWFVAGGLLLCSVLLYIIWSVTERHRVEDAMKAKVRLEFSDWSYVVEFFSTDVAGEEDYREEFVSWGNDPAVIGSRHLVIRRKVDEGKPQEVKLRAGMYLVAIHPKSPCGYHGGTSYRTAHVSPGEHLVIAIPQQ